MKPKHSNQRALRILAAASEEFASHGFDGARIDRIARTARVNKQLLFYYYHSKRGLFQGVLTEGARELEQGIARAIQPSANGARPLDRLRDTLIAQFEFLSTNRALVNLLCQAGRSDLRPFAPALTRLVVLLAEGQGRGEVRDDVDPHVTASQALGLMLAYLNLEPLIAAGAAAHGPALAVRWKEGIVQLVIDGVATH